MEPMLIAQESSSRSSSSEALNCLWQQRNFSNFSSNSSRWSDIEMGRSVGTVPHDLAMVAENRSVRRWKLFTGDAGGVTHRHHCEGVRNGTHGR